MHQWHKHPIKASEWFVSKFPERWEYLKAEQLRNKARGTILMTEYEEMECELKWIMEEMK